MAIEHCEFVLVFAIKSSGSDAQQLILKIIFFLLMQSF